MKKILFVCHGNICRSPLGEFIFKYLSKNKYLVESRATSSEEVGNDIYPNIQNELRKHNIPFSKHEAKKITIDDYDKFDIIVCFDNENILNLKKITNDLSKVIKLQDYDIEDPWYTRNFSNVYDEIYDGCLKLFEKVENIK